MSVHLSSNYAKRSVAGPWALEEALYVAMQECLHAGRLGLGIGDINMARPPFSSLTHMPLALRPLQRFLLRLPRCAAAPRCSLSLRVVAC